MLVARKPTNRWFAAANEPGHGVTGPPTRTETMNKAFCQCGRECEWPQSHEEALCRCGVTIEPQTPMERGDKRQAHAEKLQRISTPHFKL